ncbi:MAG: cupin domain-containing protein [Bacteroidota bacterium]
MTPELLIEKFHLKPHPEGGYFIETYRSAEVIPHHALPERFEAERNFSTAIYFLLIGDEFSSFHRIAADELWHFYIGSPVEIVMIDNDGKTSQIILGQDILSGESVQFLVPAGVWFASRCMESSGFSLVGCTVAPGFDFSDFELAEKQKLIEFFPQHGKLISRFTRS